MTFFLCNVIITLDGVFFMRKKWIGFLSLFFMIITVAGCSCNGNKVKVTFVSNGSNDIVRYVKKGSTLLDVPQPPAVKGKYCLWDRQEFLNVEEDIVVTSTCYSTVTQLTTNIPSVIDVDVASPEADLEYIFKDIELEATFETGETKRLYENDYTIVTNNYNKDVSGNYTIGIKYNNLTKNIRINVHKITNYVSVYLNGLTGYYSEGLPELLVNTQVPGRAEFDPNQTLGVGAHHYNWTFYPTDTQKYDIVKGTIKVDLIKASSISANKSSLVVDYGTDKDEIISALQENLIVEAAYGQYYREISSKYYTIDSTEFIADMSGIFKFRISYDTNVYVDIPVTVLPCETYTLSVESQIDTTEYSYEPGDTFEDILEYIVYRANNTLGQGIQGEVSFVEGQILTPGTYTYEYIFTPDSIHYAPKHGNVTITI